MNTWIARLASGVLLSLVLAACGGETRTKPQTCSSDAQCTGGKVCQSGTCANPPSNPTNACADDSDCAAGEKCDAGTCEASGGGSCQTAMDCPADQYCQSRVCVDGGGGDTESCTTTADCTGGKKCNTYGECVGCTKDTDCTGGKTCSSSYTCTSETCDDDTDCGTGSKCKTTAAAPHCVQCVTDADCAGRSRLRSNSSKVCRNDICTSPTCSTNADCGDQICNTTTKACEGCTANTQCTGGKVCTSGHCLPPGTNPTCTKPSDCGGLACTNGTCERCTQDSQCTTGTGSSSTPGLCNTTTGACGPVECTTASQCDAGEACYAPGRCGPCIADNECRAGEYCVITGSDTTGWCQGGTGTGSCTSNAQCPQDLVCYQGTCQTCLKDSECDACEVCSWNNRCITNTAGNSSCTPTGACTSNAQCPYSQTCVAGYCTTTGGTGGTGTFGTKCTNNSQCAYGLTCAGMDSSNSVCTSTCVGSGNGGNDDCPSGWACVDWESTTLDGLKMCYRKDQLGSGMMGYPFTTPPGGACDGNSPYSNTCQTSVCTGFNDCARLCNSNGDCGTNNVCYAYPDQYVGYVHECWPSDPSTYLLAGEACSDNSQCDSGICLGQCASGDPCGSDNDCSDGQGCYGTCVDHCRSVNDCPGDAACNFWPMYISGGYGGWTPVCSGRIYNGSGGLGSACSSDANCDSEWCIDGKCTTPCATANDCFSGLACTPINFYSGSTPVYSGSFCL